MPRLNHVSLSVADRERSAAFYATHFGLARRVHEDAQLLILAAEDGGLLALVEGPVPAPPPPALHFGCQAGSIAEVHAARARFRDAGVAEAEWQDDGITRVQVFDPDGYRVEIFAW
ncbi:MAG: VOC family protein [Paracoccaceae bacterium]